MIGYVMLGTNDLQRATRFYDALLGEIGARRVIERDRFIGWGADPGHPLLIVTMPYNNEPATAGNGTMVALQLPSPAEVMRLHARALELEATDEGAPGFRFGTFYAAYLRDLDGNKLALYCISPKAA